MPQIRVHFISRDEDTGSDSLGGLIDESSLFECPHWTGIAGATHYEILIRFAWTVEEGQAPQKSWLCYFKAIHPDLQFFSPPDEREEWKEYVDGKSHVVQFTEAEAIEWFKRHGRELPQELKVQLNRAGAPASSSSPPTHPYVHTNAGAIPLTESDPPSWHLQWIETNAAILRENFDTIEHLAANRHVPIVGEVDRAIRISESNRLSTYHDLRIALLRETGRYLPDVQILVLRDMTRAWQWDVPLPDREQFIAEMQRIEHEANREIVRIQNAQQRSDAEQLSRFCSDLETRLLGHAEKTAPPLGQLPSKAADLAGKLGYVRPPLIIEQNGTPLDGIVAYLVTDPLTQDGAYALTYRTQARPGDGLGTIDEDTCQGDAKKAHELFQRWRDDLGQSRSVIPSDQPPNSRTSDAVDGAKNPAPQTDAASERENNPSCDLSNRATLAHTKECPIKLRGEGLAPFICGAEAKELFGQDYAIIAALVAAWPNGRTKGQLENAGFDSPHKRLGRIRKRSRPWNNHIRMPGKNGRGGYRIA